MITFAAAPGDGEVNAILGDGFGESDPTLAGLLAAAAEGKALTGVSTAWAGAKAGTDYDLSAQQFPALAGEAPEQKGYLCAVDCAFNLHAARRVTGNDKRLSQSPKVREMLCRYILRPPLANERLRLLEDGSVTVDFKRPWSDGTRSIGLAPKALLSRMAALIPPPRRHVTVYSGVLSSNSKWRQWIVPSHKPEPLNLEQENSGLETTPDLPFKPKAIETKSVSCRKYIPWNGRQGRVTKANLWQ